MKQDMALILDLGITGRIINEINGVNRVGDDLTPKPTGAAE
jgi:hypothetical protein